MNFQTQAKKDLLGGVPTEAKGAINAVAVGHRILRWSGAYMEKKNVPFSSFQSKTEPLIPGIATIPNSRLVWRIEYGASGIPQ
jgi:hypothetical protein